MSVFVDPLIWAPQLEHRSISVACNSSNCKALLQQKQELLQPAGLGCHPLQVFLPPLNIQLSILVLPGRAQIKIWGGTPATPY